MMENILVIFCILLLCALAVMIFILRSLMKKIGKNSENSGEQEEIRRRESEKRQIEQLEKLLSRQEDTARAQTDLLNKQYETRIEAIQTRQEQQLEAIQLRHEQQLNSLKAEYEQRRQAEEQKSRRELETLRQESANQFQALAANIMKAQTEGLKQQNMEQLEAILRPLSENIDGFRKAVNDTYVQENASRKSLTDQIDRLMKLNESIGSEARNLTYALKGNSKVQGDWGEMVLETMLQNAGLEKGIHYVTQPTHDDDGSVLTNDDGRRQRPDVVINMPDSRRLIIDSKVSLTAFTEYCAEDNPGRRKQLAREHIASVKRHIDELAAKKYQDSISGSADHVMMFIPNEGAYIAAVQEDTDLWQYAYSRHVALVSPTHLFSAMRIVSQLWVQDKQNRNTLEIARKGGALYDKVMLYMESMLELGNALDKARSSYDTALTRLATGRGNVARLSSDLQKLGAKATKAMPSAIAGLMETDNESDKAGETLPE